MDRKEFFKKACGLGICSCMGISLLSKCSDSNPTTEATPPDETTADVPADARQIQNLLTYIESSCDESVSKNIFGRLGAEHLTDPQFALQIGGMKQNIKGYFDYVNSGKDTYWEKIEYNPEASTITITGKPVEKCACPYAQHANPPLSLCTTCCTNFQKAMFEMLLDKTVTKVQTDEAFLLGGTRCSTTLFIEGELQLENAGTV